MFKLLQRCAADQVVLRHRAIRIIDPAPKPGFEAGFDISLLNSDLMQAYTRVRIYLLASQKVQAAAVYLKRRLFDLSVGAIIAQGLVAELDTLLQLSLPF